MCRAIALLACCALSAPAAAADLRIVNRERLPLARIAQSECNVMLSGRIEAGDADKLRKLDIGGVRETDVAFRFDAGAEGHVYKSFALCLQNSNGGSFQEALKIVALLRSEGWSTVVPRDGRCLSACAVAFLGGSMLSSNSSGGERAPHRILHVTGVLGFHAPIVPPLMRGNQPIQFQAALGFFDDGIGAVRTLSRTLPEDDLPGAGPALPSDLLLEMLSHFGGDNFFYIDTVDKAGAYNIRLAGAPRVALDAAALARLCSNVVTWAFSAHDPLDADLTSWSYETCRLRKPKPVAEDEEEEGPRLSDAEVDEGSCTSVEEAKSGARLDAALAAGVEITSRHQICRVQGAPDSGDDFEVSYRRSNGEMRSRYLESWHSLPWFVPLAALKLTAAPFDVSPYRVVTLPERERASTPAQQAAAARTFISALPGDTLVLDAPSDPEREEYLRGVAINFRPDGVAEVVWHEGEMEVTRYRLEPGRACFDRLPRVGAGSTCATLSFTSDGTWVWTFANSKMPGLMVQHMRPGQVPPRKEP